MGIIPLAAAVSAWLAPRSGFRLEAGVLVAGAALLILLQGFGRDLWLLREARRQKTVAPPRAVRSMCVESALGLTGVLAGVGLTGFGLTQPVLLGAGELAAGVVLAMLAGFLLKDFVFEWSPWRIYREKGHAQVIFRWRP